MTLLTMGGGGAAAAAGEGVAKTAAETTAENVAKTVGEESAASISKGSAEAAASSAVPEEEATAVAQSAAEIRGAAGRASAEVSPLVEVESRTAARLEPIDPAGHANAAFRVTFEDGSRGVFKPALGEDAGLRESIPAGSQWRREIAASEVDQRLGYDLVPRTRAFGDDLHGHGSLQDWAEGAKPSHDAARYAEVDQQRMAVLDYLVGNTDRHIGNWLTGAAGRPVAIDNGLSFPTHAVEPLRSDFIARWIDKPLDASVVGPLRELNIDELVLTWRRVGLSQRAIDGAIARLTEVIDGGTITGEAWSGRITDAEWGTVK